ncbi:cytochrome P450 4C1-like [Spodoptera litura]|uniref:Cytochrome P450 4C1-like n=1 Tax=Spodoptera litura TaxID=69820 RepID=A0A9J7EAI2_SPOLT|nr:cytochrome P450 4C1-like [Spodoptera litura]
MYNKTDDCVRTMLSLLLFVCVVCIASVWSKYARGRPKYPLPPAMPGALPIVGVLHQVLKNYSRRWDFLKSKAEECAKLGGVTYAHFGSELYYVITDPQDALTASNQCLKKHYAFDLAKVWMGNGLVLSSGDIWKRHRKLLSPAFTLPIIHSFLDVFNSQAKKLASSMEPHVGKGLFDPFLNLKLNALETFCVGTLGIEALDDVNFTERYMESVDDIVTLWISRVVKVWLLSDVVWKLTGLKKKEQELVDTLHTMTNKVLQRKKAALKNKGVEKVIESQTSGIKYRPFLDLLLELSTNGAFTDEEIREETDTIIAAGYDTTSNQITFVLLLLGAYPDEQEKVYEELLRVLGPDRDIEKDDINKLVYTNAVIMESLRLFPSIPSLFRTVETDVKLKNYTMPAGSYCVIFPIAASSVDPSWGPEPDKFRPERWLHGDFRHNKEYSAFGLGKRACIGRTYAMISMKVTLAHFLRQYRVKADLSKLKLNFDFLLKPISGHDISIESRRK